MHPVHVLFWWGWVIYYGQTFGGMLVGEWMMLGYQAALPSSSPCCAEGMVAKLARLLVKAECSVSCFHAIAVDCSLRYGSAAPQAVQCSTVQYSGWTTPASA